MLKPGNSLPDFSAYGLEKERWRFSAEKPRLFTVLAFYRGSFCRFCRSFLADLKGHLDAFDARGLSIIAISCDDEAQARLMLPTAPPIRYGLEIGDARRLGLFVSRRSVDGIAHEYTEPSLMIVRPGGEIYAIFQGSLSCGRPDIASLLEGFDLLTDRGFPLRGGD